MPIPDIYDEYAIFYTFPDGRNKMVHPKRSKKPSSNLVTIEEGARPFEWRILRQSAEYFGPSPTAGPFTDSFYSNVIGHIPLRAVPASPQAPGDIMAPVEINSRSVSGPRLGSIERITLDTHLS